MDLHLEADSLPHVYEFKHINSMNFILVYTKSNFYCSRHVKQLYNKHRLYYHSEEYFIIAVDYYLRCR